MKLKLPDGFSIYYEHHFIDDSKYTLVFLNGLSQSTVSWYPIVQVLKNQFNIVLIDSIFQGQSDQKGDYRSFEQHAADANQVLEKINAKRIVPIGISYGGAVAMRLLVNYPTNIEKAVLLSTFANRTPYFDFIGNTWRSALLSGGYELMLDVMLPAVLGQDYFFSPLIPIQDIQNARLLNKITSDSLMKLMDATENSGDYREELKSVSIQVKVIHGSQDILTTPKMGQNIVDALPNASFKLLPRKGHTLNLEAIPELILEIENFLKV
ncbi:putative hydrolase or acyltransferase of alpha/beta superfamily [Bernardetia litoralis DSM 6794]|uniref:Putative hydrolase or acyltransferase of alpha/beta superfamily n=1 Tax=Bernardetia litoralis (strain ATCC 23117 / DSM 6794 / NBRC 15988 / NCIMB 1366 / Fx l1 / Sio-4) TaxID=880071 RepID=I4AKQ1_BERLS|nr:alpha/beta hydrolase [Bernardetia litoralis]AFM04536.1 putative hydrolase or acyltransferase of alpha/beta superfamily [Bernardetia litoralis DSM 6794]